MILPAVVICLIVTILITFIYANPLHYFDYPKPYKTPWLLIEALGASGQLKGFNGTWFSGDSFYFTSSNGLEQYNVASDKTSIFLSSHYTRHYKSPSYTLSPDGKKILVRYNRTQIFRHSFIAQNDILDLATGISKPIHKGEKVQYCQWSPNSKKIAYVYENNVFIHDVDAGSEVQLTKDGIVGVVYNGIPDWVYEEEVLSSGSAIWWSPDGNKITVGFFNDTKVETFKYFLYSRSNEPIYQYPEEVDLKYPKPNTPNPIVSLKVYDLLESRTNVITAPTDIVSKDHILQHATWSDNDSMIITWLNRRQNIGTMQKCQLNGKCKEVHRFSEPKGWISLESSPSCKSGFCYFTYWIGNWYQVWKLDLEKGINVQKSLDEEITVQKFYGSNSKGDIFYQATLPHKPHIYHVFKNNECLSCEMKDEAGVKCQMAQASFSKTFDYYSMTCTGPSPSFTQIFSSTKGLIKTWENNEILKNKIYIYKQFPTIEYLNVTLGDGYFGMAKLHLPPSLDFKKPDPTKKYPLIVMVYGGPNSVQVKDLFSIGWPTYLTTSREIIYAQVDVRGTGNKGKDFLFTVNNHLGSVEIEDQIAVARSLIQSFQFIDKSRTGIWGWSYGGYVTAMTMAKDSDKVFKCGVSVAPVTAWYYYDTIYTERFMGLPTEEDNLKNYIEGDISQNITNFRTHKFLLIHGSGDDNVHIQHSLILAKKLQYADIDFEEMTYTDENHSIGNAVLHLYHTMDRFWGRCFKPT